MRNLDFIDFLSQEDYYHFLTDADIVFLSQKKDSGDVYFPSKLLGIMAKEKLIFVSADKDSEIYKVVSGNQVGMAADFGDLDHMQQLLTDYLHDKARSFGHYKTNALPLRAAVRPPARAARSARGDRKTLAGRVAGRFLPYPNASSLPNTFL